MILNVTVIPVIKKLMGTENKRKLAVNFFYLIVLRGFQFLIPLVTLPYLVRTVGLENFGMINFALSLGIYFGAVIQFGFSVTATREVARYRDTPAELRRIYSDTLSASIVLSIISIAIFLSIVFFVEKLTTYASIYMFTIFYIVFQNLFPIWFFQGMEKMKYITFLSLGSSAMYLASLFLFVRQESDYILVPLLHGLAALVTFVLALFVIEFQFKVRYRLPTWKQIAHVLDEGKDAFVSQLAPNFYNNSAVFLLGLFTNNTFVGVYTAATKVIDAVISFSYILSNTFLPYLSRSMARHKLFSKIMMITGWLLTIFTFVSAETISGVLFGEHSADVAGYVRWLSVCILFIFVNMTYGNNYLMLVGKDRVVRNINLYVSILFFLIALAAIPLVGIWGAIGVLVGARASIAILQFIFYRKHKNTLG